MAKADKICEVAVCELRPYDNNAKVHSDEQVDMICNSIKEFGFISPCLIDKDNRIIAGHGRVMAAKKLGLKKVPCVYIEGLTEEQYKAYIIADNRLTELGGWDEELLNAELEALSEEGFDIELTGFDLNIDKDEMAQAESEELNPLAALPDSRILVCSISAFGTDTERFIEISLSNEEAERLLKRTTEMEVAEIAEKLRGAVNDL